MAFTLVQKSTVSLTGSASLTGVTAGNMLVVKTGNPTSFTDVSAVADNVNGTWSRSGMPHELGTGVYFFDNTASGNVTVTVTAGGTVRVVLEEWAYDGSSVAIAGINTAITFGGSGLNHGSVTLTGPGLILTAIAGDNTLDGVAATSGFTGQDDGTTRFYEQYRVEPTSYTGTAPLSVSNNPACAGAILALEEVGGGGDPAPSITDVDEDNTISQTQANVEIDGTDFDTATVELRQGGFVYTPSIDSQSGTAITFDMPALGATGPISAPHAGAVTLAVVNGDDQEDTQAITVTDESGTETYLIGTPNADPDLRLTASADAVSGDYVRISNVVGGSITDVNVNSDLTWDADEAVTSFDVQYWDAADGTWGDRETQDLEEVVDETPDAFSFTDQTGVTPGSTRTSNTITVSGLGTGVSVAVSVSGGSGTYSKNGAGYTASAGTATNGDTFSVRHTASGSYSTAVNTTLDIGGVTDEFRSTTQANAAPSFVGPSISNLVFQEDIAITPVDFSSLFTDIESLTFTAVGALPTGLSLSSAGVLSGTPTTIQQVTSIEIRASDGSLTTDSNSFNIDIIAAITPASGRSRDARRFRGARGLTLTSRRGRG